MSYAAILGGSATLIGASSNLVVAGMIGELLKAKEAATPHMEKLTIFDPGVVAVPMVIAALAFIMLTGARLLPTSERDEKRRKPRRIHRSEFFAPRDSALIGKSVEEIGLNAIAGCSLKTIVRDGVVHQDVGADFVIEARDVLSFHSTLDALSDIWAVNGLAPFNTTRGPKTQRFRHSLAQVAISRKSPVVGRKISELPLPGTPYRITIVGVSRMGRPPGEALRNVKIEAGDVAIVEVNNSFYYQEDNEVFFSMIRKFKNVRLQRVDRAVWAALITVSMISAAALGWMSMLNAGLLAAGAMLLTGCIHLKGAARSVNFTTLVTIAGAIGIQAAINRSGLADGIASVLYFLGGGDPHMAIIVIFTGCALMNMMLTSVATAVFLFPIALSLSGQLGVSFMPFAITLMMGAACSFISPMGYQTNLMVLKPGGYVVKDYVRIGVPLTILCGAVTSGLAPVFFPFTP
ncbi:MAG: hypothetical protein GY859_18090 [Desulfobacterales bacterium]|nr:hypothetical protein [Desulfobacterales bacterium]